jgi:phospholipid transport system substrate-binding protein
MKNISMRHAHIGLLTALALCLTWKAAVAATPAETFISSNIQTGLTILDNKQLTAAERKFQFETFLLGVTDMKRIALFTLGPYAASTTQTDKDAFANGFQDYAVAVYQSYFEKYSGQTLTVVRSNERAPGDFVVVTNMINTRDHSGQPPLEIDFRVRTDSVKPEIVDFSVAGIWLALAERDDFSAALAKSKGDVPALTAHLHSVASQY